MKKFVFIIAAIMAICISTQYTYSQKGIEDGSQYGKGHDSVVCVKSLSLYREFVKQNNYKDALGPWRVVFTECPKSSKNIYIDGVKLYSDLIQKEKDPEIQNKLIDTLMMIYDQRILYFKQEGNVRGRQGVDLLRFKRDDLDALKKGYDYLSKSIELEKNKSSLAVIATYMMATFSLKQSEKIECDQVIKNFLISDAILDEQYAKEKDEQIQEVKVTILSNLITSGCGSCESMIAYYEPMFEEKKNDLNYLKSVTNLLSGLKCEESDLFGNAAIARLPLDPSAEAAVKIAQYFAKKEEYGNAADYYKKAVELETDSSKLADYYNQLAKISVKLNQYSSARSYAYKAINNRQGFGEPYLYIGISYALGASGCGDDFTQRTVYWAAVDKFYQAKSVDPSVSEDANKYINAYSGQFPDKEELFMRGMKDGDSYSVGCWINETTKVRPR